MDLSVSCSEIKHLKEMCGNVAPLYQISKLRLSTARVPFSHLSTLGETLDNPLCARSLSSARSCVSESK